MEMTQERLACLILVALAFVMTAVTDGGAAIVIALQYLLIPTLFVLFSEQMRFFPIHKEAHRRGVAVPPFLIRGLGWIALVCFTVTAFVDMLTKLTE